MGQQVQHESRINVGEATHVSKAEMGANTMFATSRLNSNNKVGPELAYSYGVANSASDSSTAAPSPCYLCHKVVCEGEREEEEIPYEKHVSFFFNWTKKLPVRYKGKKRQEN
jgi:hypothetical protein